ncbi:MAG: CPBP family intramembrane metalloprotease [Clostridia bacterium]|nr:CPBP family intramembrane metalloprotease [Clostridia bacterium]
MEKFNKKQTTLYLIWTFAIAYTIQAGVAVLYEKGQQQIGQLVMAGMMFVPLLSVLLAGGKLRGMGWKPKLKGNIPSLLAAWFLPAVLTVVGSALYFLIFPSHFDISGAALTATAGDDALSQLEQQGLTYPMYILVTAISAVTIAPFLNMFAAVGEEAGWRGFLYPQLKTRFGKRKAYILGGAIWGAWHFPLIWLIGYEYGTDYIGFPVVGMLVFGIYTIVLGIIHDAMYEKTSLIWLPAIFHGAFNAIAALPLMLCIPDIGSHQLLGPAPNGIIAEIPTLIIAAVIFIKADAPTKTE